MNFLQSFLSLENIVLSFLGVVGIMAFMAISRIMRKGRQSYDNRHQAMDARIKETEQGIRERNNAMHGRDQLHIVAEALRDALSQKGHEAEKIIVEHTDHICFKLKNRSFSVYFLRKETTLRSTKKIVHGKGLWQLHLDDKNIQSFTSLIQLERYLLTAFREDGLL